MKQLHEWMRFRTCGRKVPYGHKDTAERAAKQMESKGKATGLQAYECPYCDKWHIGHGSNPKVAYSAVLRIVRRDGGSTCTEIAEQLRIDRRTVGKILAELAKSRRMANTPVFRDGQNVVVEL